MFAFALGSGLLGIADKFSFFFAMLNLTCYQLIKFATGLIYFAMSEGIIALCRGPDSLHYLYNEQQVVSAVISIHVCHAISHGSMGAGRCCAT